MLFPRMNMYRPILLLVIGMISSCAWLGSKTPLEQAVVKADKNTLLVNLEEHSDGTASYLVRSPSGLCWKFPTLGYVPGALGVDGMKQRDYYGISPISSANLSVVALQEHGELGCHGLFVVRGHQGTLFVIKGPIYYAWIVEGLTRNGLSMQASGMPMGKAFFKWHELVVKKVGEFMAIEKTQQN